MEKMGGVGGPKNVKRAQGDNNRKKLDTSVTLATGLGAKCPPVKGGFVALNEGGTQRIGEDHARAKLSDVAVDCIRNEYEAGLDGSGPRIGYKSLAKKWGCSKRTVRDIVHYRKRNQWAARWKRVA